MTENEIIENLDDIWTFGHEPTDEERISANKAIDLIQELQQYRKIGTIEECREARERQIGKKPNKSDVHPYFRKHCSNIYSCPFCNKKLTHHKQKFCQYCGQAIDWHA